MLHYVSKCLLIVIEMLIEDDVMLVGNVLEDGVTMFLTTSVQYFMQILVYGRLDFGTVVLLHLVVPGMDCLEDILEEVLLHFPFGLLVVDFKQSSKV